MEKVTKSDSEWKKIFTPEQYRILREKGTELAFTGKYYKSSDKGVYKCAGCGNPLFSSDAKFDSKSGWPSFNEPIKKDSIEYREDNSHGMRRTEAVCGKCGAHLGHVFSDEGESPPASDFGRAGASGGKDGSKKMPDGAPATGKRYCINSVCLDLDKKNPGDK